MASPEYKQGGISISAWRNILFEQIEHTVEMLPHIVLDRALTVNWDAVFFGGGGV